MTKPVVGELSSSQTMMTTATSDKLNDLSDQPTQQSWAQRARQPDLARTEKILVVDDDVWVVDLITNQLAMVGFPTVGTTDSSQVLDMMAQQHYNLVISDITMPYPDGLTLLQQIRELYPFTAVLMLTANKTVKTATEAMLEGARDYLVKPHDETQLLLRVERALEHNHLLREQALYYQRLEDRVQEQTKTLRQQSTKLASMFDRLLVTYKATLKALEASLDVRDQSSPGHCRRVSKLAVRLAKHMGLKGQTLTDIEHGALLHDIGKLSVPDAILLKPGPLTPEERRVMDKHPEIGMKIVKHIEFLQGALPIILHHHERYDGTGYPQGLKGTNIPLPIRIFSVVDAYDAQISQRPYNTVRSTQEALNELANSKRTSFDPQVVDAFVEMMTINPANN